MKTAFSRRIMMALLSVLFALALLFAARSQRVHADSFNQNDGSLSSPGIYCLPGQYVTSNASTATLMASANQYVKWSIWYSPDGITYTKRIFVEGDSTTGNGTASPPGAGFVQGCINNNSGYQAAFYISLSEQDH